MLQTTVRVTLRPRPWRLLAWFTAAFALVWVSGRACEHRLLGRTDEEGRRIVADGGAAGIRRAARGARTGCCRRLPAPRPDAPCARRPRGGARPVRALAAIGDSEVAISVYGSDAAPLAWSGRPSELPGARVSGPRPCLSHLGRRDSGSCWCSPSPPPATSPGARPAPSLPKPPFRPAGRPIASARRRSRGPARPCRCRSAPDTRAAASRSRRTRSSLPTLPAGRSSRAGCAPSTSRPPGAPFATGPWPHCSG